MRAVLVALASVALSGCVYYLNPQCNDQIHNGDETDIDCGGPCGLCNVGQSCNLTTECDESNCIDGTCTPYDCDNGVKGQAETDVDCGGPMCRMCSGGRHCSLGTDCFSGVCDGGTCFELATVSFADAVSYPSGLKTYALFSSDMNADGRTDLVAANEEANSLSVFLQTTTGTFQPLVSGDSAYITGDYPTGGAIVDFNHDTIPDVITSDYHGNSISLLLGTGGGMLGPKHTTPTIAGAETSNLAVGDLDGDGNLDVVATNPANHSMSVFKGHADGTFDAGTTTPIGDPNTSFPYSAAIGDFDGDGKLDLATADEVTGPILVMHGNGDGTFGDSVIYSTGGVGPFILITRDLNLDGKLDLVCSNRGSDGISVLIGRGDGTFRAPIVSSTGAGTGPYSIAVTDFNKDGVPDVATADFMTGTGTVLIGLGDGHFEPAIAAGATGVFSYGVAVGDFNGDGKPDFATANAAGNNVTVKLSTSH